MKRSLPQPGPCYPALLQLLHTAETLWNASRLFFDQWDLSASQFNLLNLLYESPDVLTQIELSRRLITHRSNITGLVDRLEKRNLVQRDSSPDDRRVYRVTLTPSGRKLTEEIRPQFFAVAEQIWANVETADARRLDVALKQIQSNTQQMAEEYI